MGLIAAGAVVPGPWQRLVLHAIPTRAEYLQAFAEPVPKPADAQILQFGVYSRRARWRRPGNGDGTVAAEVIARGRGRRDPAGRVPAGETFGGVAARQWLACARPGLWRAGGFAPTGSGGGCGPVAAGSPCPVHKHAHDGTGKCGPHPDQGDLPAGHVGVGRGPESDDPGGRAWRPIRPPPGRRRARLACRRDGRWCGWDPWRSSLAVGWRWVRWSGAGERWQVTGGGRQRRVLVPVRPVRAPAGSAGAVASYPGCLDLDGPPGGVVHLGHGQPEPVPQAAQPFAAGPGNRLFQVPPVGGVSWAGGGAGHGWGACFGPAGGGGAIW